jgi:hypothetical protein
MKIHEPGDHRTDRPPAPTDRGAVAVKRGIMSALYGPNASRKAREIDFRAKLHRLDWLAAAARREQREREESAKQHADADRRERQAVAPLPLVLLLTPGPTPPEPLRDWLVDLIQRPDTASILCGALLDLLGDSIVNAVTAAVQAASPQPRKRGR